MGAGLKVGDVMTKDVICINRHSSVHEAASLMRHHKIGSIVVVSGQDVKGILTEGDIVRKIVAEGRDPENTSVSEIMSAPVIVIKTDEEIESAARYMKKKGVKRLPVINEEGKLMGIISETDIVRLLPSLLDLIEEKIIMGEEE